MTHTFASYLVQVNIHGQQVTIARRSSYKSAKSKARLEARQMKRAHGVSIIRKGDPELLRQEESDNFQLR